MLFRLLFPPRKPRPEGSGVRLRYLGPNDADAFRAHIHELHYEDFRDRFNGLVSDEWLDSYIARSLDKAVVIGAYDGDRLVAVADMHTGGSAAPGEAEAAFSVAADWRRKGLGTLLIGGLLKAAAQRKIAAIIVETGSQNLAMKALARKFGAKMKLAGEQSVGRIDVAQGLKLMARDREHLHFPRIRFDHGDGPMNVASPA